MKKRFIIWLSALLITLLPVLGSRAEEAAVPDSPAESDVWVIYVPQIGNNSDQQTTIQYVAKAINEYRSGKSIAWYKVGTTQRNPVTDGYPGDDWFGNISTVKGADPFKEEDKSKIAAEIPHEIWVLVPSAASENIVQNEDWEVYFGSILAGNANTIIRFLFIGKDSVVPQRSSVTVQKEAETSETIRPMDRLIGSYPDQVEWMAFQDRFADETTDTGTIHTGDYFLASLFGKPVDLKVEPDENNALSFTVPSIESGEINILVLRKPADGSEEPIPTVRRDGETKEADRSFALRGARYADPRFGVVYLANVAPGKYTVNGTENEVKAYWYPDLSEDLGATLTLNPAPVDGIWNRSKKDIILSIHDDLDRFGAFSAGFRICLDGADRSPGSEMIQADAASKSWTCELMVDTNVRSSVSVTPTLELSMDDGNLIWKMQENTQEIKVRDQELKLIKPETSETIYIYGDQISTLEQSWDDYFDYNKDDNPALDVSAQEGTGIAVNQTGDGFRVTVEDVSKAIETGECIITLTGKDSVSDEEKKATIHLQIIDASKLACDISVTVKPEETEINAGASAEVIVSCNNPAAWTEAKQKIDSFPEWDALTVKAALGGQDPVNLSRNGNVWENELTIPVNVAADQAISLTVEVWNGERQIAIPADQAVHSWTVINNAPEYKGQVDKKQEISIGGIPDFVPFIGGYDEVELLKTANITDAWNLFEDAETPDTLVVKVSISPVDGLRKEESKQKAPEEGQEEAAENPADAEQSDSNEWTFDLTAETSRIPAAIYALKPGTYTIKMSATDGVNTSEIQEITIEVKSSMMRIFSFAGLGLGILLLLLIALLIIRHARKPKFDRIQIRCLTWSDDSQERGREMMNKTRPTPMAQFGKNPATLDTVLMLTRQPALSKEQVEVAEDITLLPTKHDELVILFGKKAMTDLGQQDKKISLSQGNVQRIRLGNQYVFIENVQ